MNADVELLHALVALPSVSGDEHAASTLLVAHMAAEGFDAHVDEVNNAVGTKYGGPAPDGAEQRTLMLLGHIDTVPGVIPVRIENGVLFGRGSVDAKGCLATFTRAVASVTPAPGVNLVVIGVVEEEVPSSKGARHVAPLFAPEACIIGEPSGWDAVTLGYKGCLRLMLDYEAPVGHSAGPLPPVAEAAADLWQALKNWCNEHNATRPALFDQVLPSLQQFVTKTDGLHDRVHVAIGFRLPPDFEVGELEAVVQANAPGVPYKLFGHEKAWSSGAGSTLVRSLRRSILKADGKATLKRKTGTSDMNVVGPVWQCPIVAYGPGDSTLDHTPNEHLPLDEYERAIAVLRAALIEGGWAV